MKRTLLLGRGFPLCSLSQRERVRGFVPQAGQGIIHAASVLPASLLPIRCTLKDLEEALQSALSATPARAARYSPAQSSSASAMPDGFSAANVAASPPYERQYRERTSTFHDRCGPCRSSWCVPSSACGAAQSNPCLGNGCLHLLHRVAECTRRPDLKVPQRSVSLTGQVSQPRTDKKRGWR